MAYIRSKVIDEGMYYLLLDEIQMLDCFEAVLNGYLRKENMDVFVTGSNAKLLSKDMISKERHILKLQENITFLIWDFVMPELTSVSLNSPTPWRMSFTTNFVCVVTV